METISELVGVVVEVMVDNVAEGDSGEMMVTIVWSW